MYVLLSTIKRSDVRSGERGVMTVLHRSSGWRPRETLRVVVSALLALGLLGCDGAHASPASAAATQPTAEVPAAGQVAAPRFTEEIHQPSLVLGLRAHRLYTRTRP